MEELLHELLGYKGDYIGDYYSDMKGDTRSLDNGSHDCFAVEELYVAASKMNGWHVVAFLLSHAGCIWLRNVRPIQIATHACQDLT